MDTYMHSPSLTEPGVRYFLKETLKQCQQKKIKFYHFWTNIGFLILFMGILASLLVWKQQTKKSKEEIIEERMKQREYILEKIKSLQPGQKEKREQNLIITELPQLDSGFDVLHKNYYSI